MDAYEYQAKVASLTSQIVASHANGGGRTCSITLDVTATPGSTEDLVAHMLRTRISSAGVYIKVNRSAGFGDTFICRIESAPSVLFDLLTKAYLDGGVHLTRAR